MFVSNNFNQIYLSKLAVLLVEPNLEMFHDSFCITDINNNTVKSKLRKFNKEFAQAYTEWILRGETDITKLHYINIHAKEFDSEYRGRFASYGPRIKEQLPYILEELHYNRSSRRACIMILDERDRVFAEGLRTDDTHCEYPCVMAVTFFVRDDKLHCSAILRSNNYILTVNIDVYVLTTIQKKVASLLNLSPGRYYHTSINAHIFPNQKQFALDILKERDYE